MSNFRARFVAELDTKKIDKDIKKINSKKVSLQNVTLNTKGLSVKIQEALNKHQFTLNLTNVRVDNLSSKITGSVKGAAQAAGTTFSQEFVNKINTTVSASSIDKAVSSIQSKFSKLTSNINLLGGTDTLSSETHSKYVQIEQDLQRINVLQTQLTSAAASGYNRPAAYEYLNSVLKRVQNNLAAVTSETRQFASATEVATLQNRMESWLTNNSRAAKTYGSTIDVLVSRLRELSAQGNVEKVQLQQLAAEFTQVKTAAQAAGLTGKTFGDSLKGALSSITRYIGASTLIYSAIRAIRSGISDVVDLDTALVDLRKTTDATEFELQKFYYTANDVAKQLGTTTQEVISAAAEWSRLGYSIKDAETMAQTSSIFASISPGLDIEGATDGLVSVMKAFDIEAEDALDGIASKINIIGNTQALSNKDIVEFLTRSSSAMKEANNTLEETIALGTAATEITRDASSVGKNSVADIKNGYIGQRIEVSETEERLYKYKLNTKGGEDMKKKRIVFNCEYCGKEKEQKRYDYNKAKHHYCSCECKSAAQNKRIKVTCENCGKEIIQTYTQYQRANHHYCSNECQMEFQHKLSYEDRECPICHSIFSVSKKSTQLLCSTECQKRWQTQQVGELNPRFTRIKLNCEYCGQEIYVSKYRADDGSHKFCSIKCRQNWYAQVWSQDENWKNSSRQRILKSYEQGLFSHTDTKPQRIINDLLNKLNISFINEYNCKYYSIDNYLDNNNLMIEVMGDYWHGNPNKFSMESLTEIQTKRISRDKAKHTYISNYYNTEILYLWEEDIYKHIDLCENLILLYIEKNGQLDNYHSFNYCMKNGVLKLNNNLTCSYFDKCA